jgi:crotonobetainyl-CoA:carnitine CoA-transferase CaiB-like acyl-CoA transferase
MPGPLDGLRVLDLSRVLAGPLCTQILGDLGADVVKVERPESGDDTRGWGPPFVQRDSAYFLSLNRNKRSVALDLSTAEGARAIAKLAARSDVLLENFRPGLMDSFGIGREALMKRDPSLVWCSFTAYSDSQMASKPSYDVIVQAISGLMSITGEPDGPPMKTGVAILDVVAGLYATIGILAALQERSRTGRGRAVDVSLLDASLAAMVNQAANHLLGGIVPGRLGNVHPNIVPYQVFRGADREFVLAAGNDRFFQRTCEIIGLPELATDPRFGTNEDRVEHRDELVPILAGAFETREADVWMGLLETAGVPCAPIRSMEEVFRAPEGAALVEEVPDPVRGLLRLVASPLRFDGERGATRLPPPRLGEHTDEILREIGEA